MLKTPQKAIVDALKLQGIHHVRVEFSGGGDEGHMTDIHYDINGVSASNFKDVNINFVKMQSDWATGVSTSMTVNMLLSEAIAETTEKQLMDTGINWYDNEGGDAFFNLDLKNNGFEFNVDYNFVQETEVYAAEISLEKWLEADVVASNGLVGVRQTVLEALKAQQVTRVTVRYSGYGDEKDLNTMLFYKDDSEIEIDDVTLRYMVNETVADNISNEHIASKILTEALCDICLSQAEDTGVNWFTDEGGAVYWDLKVTDALNSLGIQVNANESESAHYEESNLDAWVGLEIDSLKTSGLELAIEEMSVELV